MTSSDLTNPLIRPLTNTTSEIGVDLELFDRRLALDFTLYDRLSVDDIISTPLAPSSGSGATLINAGEISNRGVELLITGTPVLTQDLTWTASYNLAYNRNRVLRLAPGQTTGGTSLLGLDMSTFFRHTFLTTDDGTPIYDSNSNYELRTDVPVRAGVGVPPYTMGLTNTVTYKNWMIDMLIDGKFGHHFFSQAHQYMFRFGLDKATLPGREDGLTVEGVDQNGNPFTHHWPASFMDTYYNNMGTHNQMLFVQDGSFVKLRSLVLTYTVPVQRLGFVQGAQLSLVARNVANLHKKTTHFDPEQNFEPNSNSQNWAGVMMPRTRDIGLNVRLNF
jgi:outer membrane receptor protein involved in Fe transport